MVEIPPLNCENVFVWVPFPTATKGITLVQPHVSRSHGQQNHNFPESRAKEKEGVLGAGHKFGLCK